MGKFTRILSVFMALAPAVVLGQGERSLDGLFGTQVERRSDGRGAFSNSLAQFNQQQNPNSLNNVFQDPQTAFINNLTQSISQNAPKYESNRSTIQSQIEQGRQQAEQAFQGIQESVKTGIKEAGDKLVSTVKETFETAGKEEEEAASELLTTLGSLIEEGRGVDAGVSSSATPYLAMIAQDSDLRLQGLLIEAQAQLQIQAKAEQAQAQAQVESQVSEQNFLLAIESVGQQMLARGGSSPFLTATLLRDRTDAAGTTDAFTPDSTDNFGRNKQDPHFGHDHGAGHSH